MFVATEEIKKGDLVSYKDFGLMLIGVVVSIAEEMGRAEIYWQKYNCFKMVELKDLRISETCQRKRETSLELQK